MLLMKNQTADQLTGLLSDLAPPPRMVRKLQSLVVRDLVREFPEQIPEYSRHLLAQVRQRVQIPRLKCVDKRVSPSDGFAKYLFEGDGPGRFEAVRIPLLHRPEDRKYVVCVSSQVGCAMGCAFCATAKLGFQRNLATWEIVDQVCQIQEDSDHPVRGVVFMGMGEPLLNYDAVIAAARIFSEPCGFAMSGKAITISTVGIVPAIRRFTAEKYSFRLIVSLTSANQATRARLLPVERAYPLPELMEAVREYHAATRRRVTLAWTIMSGINTSREAARELAELTRGVPILLDLIDVNDPTGEFRRPEGPEADAFRDALREELQAPIQKRYSGGQDIHGGCGMLAGLTEG